MKKKILQVPVIVGKGSAQFFVEKDVTISPPSPPIFKIEEIDKKVVITDVSVIPGKVIFNAFIWKNVIYKTVEDVCDGIVNGPLFHATFKVPFGGFVEIEPIGCNKIKESDVAEVIEAFVEGEKDFLHCETTIKDVTVFNKLLEKDVVKITFKVTRTEHIPVICDDDREEDDEDKKEKHNDKCEKKWEDRREEKREKDDKREEKREKDDKHEDKCEKDEKRDDKEEKRYDCRGDYYAKCRGERFYQQKKDY